MRKSTYLVIELIRSLSSLISTFSRGDLVPWIENGMLDGELQHDPKKWRSQVNGQCMSWINSGLRERAMTRDLD